MTNKQKQPTLSETVAGEGFSPGAFCSDVKRLAEYATGHETEHARANVLAAMSSPDTLQRLQNAMNRPSPMRSQTELADSHYKSVLADHERLVRELDQALNGEESAPQASLCDLVSQVRRERAAFEVSREYYATTIQHKGLDLTIGIDGWQRPVFVQTAIEISYQGWVAGVRQSLRVKPEPLAYQWRGRFDNGNWTPWTTCSRGQAEWFTQTSENVEIRKLGEIPE